MTKELKRVVWQWLPGIVAGIIPLLIFLAVRMNRRMPSGDEPFHSYESYLFWEGLVEHLFVFSIVTSSVSTFTAFPRVFAKRKENTAIGDASLGLVMCVTLVLVFSVAMYVMQEVRQVGEMVSWGTLIVSVLLVLAAAIASFYLEMTIENLRLIRRGAKAT